MTETTKTLTLTEFLLARIEDDKQLATAAGHGCGYLHEHNGGWVEVALPDEHNARPSYEMRFIRTIDPARVLAECEAKRRLVEGFDSWGPDAEWALKVMSVAYSDHPDCDEAWRA